MPKATHLVEVVPIKLEAHPTADRLLLVMIGMYSTCVQKGMFKDGDLGAFVPPDSLVDTSRPEFAFLAKESKECYGNRARIKVKKLRGIVSMGLLVPAPAGMKAGEDAAEALGVTHYQPPEPTSTGGETAAPPEGYHPNYDVDTWYKYAHLFKSGEEVICTEKIHGTSWRACFYDGAMHCGSRTEWTREKEGVVYWRVVRENPEIEEFCRTHPDISLYGEVFGWVQSLRYGRQQDHVDYAVFDLLRGSSWIPAKEARELGKSLKWVPLLYEGPYDVEKIKALAEGPSLIPGANHIREGLVLKPLIERFDPEIGRVQTKIVSSAYLEQA